MIELFRKYQISTSEVKFDEKSSLVRILTLLDKDKKLGQHEKLWLFANGDRFFTEPVQNKYYNIEAEKFITTNGVDSIENVIEVAKMKLKAREAEQAEKLLEKVNVSDVQRQSQNLLASYYLVLSDVKKELAKQEEAIQHALKTHQLSPEEYAPCVLLGISYLEQEKLEASYSWYKKARSLGAPLYAIYDDLLDVLSVMSNSKRNEFMSILHKKDITFYYDLM